MSTTYKREQLKDLLYKEVAAICKQHSIQVKGSKVVLINKILKETGSPDAEAAKKVKKSKNDSGAVVTAQVVEETIQPVEKPGTRKRRSVPGTESPPQVPPEPQQAVPKKPPGGKKKKAAATVQTPPEVTPPTTAETAEVNPETDTSTANTTETSSANTTTMATGTENADNTATNAEVSNPKAEDTHPDNEVVRLRMNREGCNGGELHASLIWNDIADLDLHVETPGGEHLYFGNKESRDGGWLDRDMNAGGQRCEEPIENVFWASAPSGKYKIYVHNFSCHCSSDPRFTDPNRSVPFRLRLIKNDETTWFDGSVKAYEKVTCFEFNLKGSGAVGSFVVIPPNDVPATFEELCAKNKVTYQKGEGYYALKKKEDISEGKDMVLHDTKTDTFVIGHIDVCDKLNVPNNRKISLTPKNIPEDHRLFVQSTSHNRKIPADTHVLMKVPVREALKFRLGDKYKFN